jgi:hypothetical protein
MVDLNGGNVQIDIWKLTAAMELLNLTSWFLDDLGGDGKDKKRPPSLCTTSFSSSHGGSKYYKKLFHI